jgi:hypothetical protein
MTKHYTRCQVKMADVRDVKGLIDTTKYNEERREQRTVNVTKVITQPFRPEKFIGRRV